MKYRRQMAENLWKENAKEVSDFLDNLGVKETFQSETAFLSSAVAALRREFKSSSLYEDLESRGYVKYLFSEISTTSIVSKNFKARNILYIIRLLTGKCSIPVSEEEDVDMDYLDDKFMRKERKRESW